jgi:hypothetical protein
MRTRTLAGLVAGAIVVAAPVEAQRLEDSRIGAAPAESPVIVRRAPVERSIDPNDIPDPAAQVIGGVLGGAVGMFAGALAGYALETAAGCRQYDDMCGIGGFFIGGAVGEAVGLGAGVHLFGGRRGTMASALGGSLAAGIGGLLLVSGIDDEMLPAIPVMQLLAAVVMNREAAARRSLRKS